MPALALPHDSAKKGRLSDPATTSLCPRTSPPLAFWSVFAYKWNECDSLLGVPSEFLSLSGEKKSCPPKHKMNLACDIVSSVYAVLPWRRPEGAEGCFAAVLFCQIAFTSVCLSSLPELRHQSLRWVNRGNGIFPKSCALPWNGTRPHSFFSLCSPSLLLWLVMQALAGPICLFIFLS